MNGSGASVAVFGMGVLGGRVARELVSGDRYPRLSLHSARGDRRGQLERTFADARAAGVVTVRDRSDEPPESTAVVVLTGQQSSQVPDARRHLEAGRHVVTTVDAHRHAVELFGLHRLARELDRTVVVGACFSPGLSDVLGAWAADRLDEVEEIHFARHGAGGPQCARDRLDAVRRSAHIWRSGTWTQARAGSGRQLCPFPDPVASRDAYFADTAEPAIATTAFPGLRRSSARIVLNRRDRVAQYMPRLVPAPDEGGVGAIRVEVRGRTGRERTTLVLGALDRPAVAAGALGAEIVATLLGGGAPTGAIGAGGVSAPADMLGRCRVRGVRVAHLSGTGEAEPVGP